MTEPITFGTDGIRGIAGEYPLDPATVLHIGRAIGVWAHEHADNRIIVGRDTRISGGMIGHALIAGLLAESHIVHDVGVISTPGLAVVTRANHAGLGIVISASHNPVEQNGIKLFGADGYKLSDADEEAIEKLIADLDPDRPGDLGELIDGAAVAQEMFLDSLLDGIKDVDLSNIRVVLDCANGAASLLAPEAFRRIGTGEVFALKAEPNGRNINLNCGSEYVRRDRAPLLSAIQGHNADLGIAFDGDADRVVFVTPDGMLIDGDHLLGILAVQMSAGGHLPGKTVVATDMSNSGLEHFLREHGITLARTKVGDRYVMERMRAGGFVLGGEQAGHVILLDGERTAGDGIYVGLLIASLVAENKRNNGATLSTLAAQIPRYPQVIASAQLDRRVDLDGVAGLAELREATLAAFDGQGRVNIRFSGTEPNLLRAMVEGGAANNLADVVARALALCRHVAAAAESPDPHIEMVDCVTGAPVNLS